MKLKKLFSFIISSDFGFFKKPDINKNENYLTYNLIPYSTLLGILGAIIGLNGYSHQFRNKNRFPEFYEKLKGLIIGIKPLDNFPFQKKFNKYNNSTGHASNEEGGNLITNEQLLINPKYKIYVGLEENSNKELQKLYLDIEKKIKNKKTIFTLYMGKNDFPLNISNYCKYENIIESKKNENIEVSTIFLISNNKKSFSGYPKDEYLKKEYNIPFLLIENYPFRLNEKGQYDFKLINYTNLAVSSEEIDMNIGNLFKLNKEIIYLWK